MPGLILLAVMALGACTHAPRSATITQVSTIGSLMLGQYHGHTPVCELLRVGDFGIGTFDHLDGEMIVLDGVAYQALADGTVRRCDPDAATPFAVVTTFRTAEHSPCPPMHNLAELEAHIDAATPAANLFAAVRVEGAFASLTLRSVPRQSPPFRPLAEVVKEQSVWTRGPAAGTLVGFRCPPWVGNINVPGYHWHFLSHDRTVGGHVMDVRLDRGTVATQVCRDWRVRLDPDDAGQTLDLTQDMSDDLERVERLRGSGDGHRD